MRRRLPARRSEPPRTYWAPSCWPTCAAVLLEQLADDLAEAFGEAAVQIGRRGRGVVEDPLEDAGGRAAGERSLTGRHLVEHYSEGEEIGAGVDLLAARLLGRHVGDRPERRARAGGEFVGRHRGVERRLAAAPAPG